jgi:Protein of unknown function (DUF2934)
MTNVNLLDAFPIFVLHPRNQTGASMRHPTEEQIREHAYQLWEVAGKPEDREQEFWYQAEHELKHGNGEASWASSNPDEKSEPFLE